MVPNLNRFILAQDGEYSIYPPISVAYNELKNGNKVHHWIWYVFPQIAGLGHSFSSKLFSIKDIDEARAYLKHPILRTRLMTAIKMLMINCNKSLSEVIPKEIDRKKIQSSMTLFNYISPNDVFMDVLLCFFNGIEDDNTLKIINGCYVQK